MNFESSNSTGQPRHPLTRLPWEDLDLIAELVLRSGSLKDLAAAYRVSYPTIRARLDRVIERLQVLAEGRTPEPLTNMLAHYVERGELSARAARSIRMMVRQTHVPKPGWENERKAGAP